MVFRDRNEAADILAEQLAPGCGTDTVIYGIPRGGTIMARRVGERLHVPTDMVLVRKIGHPDEEEYAIAAVSESGDLAVNEQEVARVDAGWFSEAVKAAQAEAVRRRQSYLKGVPKRPVAGTAVLVDDGMATGLTVEAAVGWLKRRVPNNIVVAVPVASTTAVARLAPLVDRVIVLEPTEEFGNSVGEHYLEFPQISDDEVLSAITRHCPA
jgi:putative phosphoribosyl transferase